MISEETIRAITQKIVEVARPQKIILFGSYANGTATPDSDLDLLVIQETDLKPVERTVSIRKHLRGFKVPMDLLVYTPTEIAGWKDVRLAFVNIIQRQGKVVYAEA